MAAEKLSNLTIRFLLRRGIAPKVWAMLDDTEARSRPLPHKMDAAIGRLMQTQPLTVRIDFD